MLLFFFQRVKVLCSPSEEWHPYLDVHRGEHYSVERCRQRIADINWMEIQCSTLLHADVVFSFSSTLRLVRECKDSDHECYKYSRWETREHNKWCLNTNSKYRPSSWTLTCEWSRHKTSFCFSSFAQPPCDYCGFRPQILHFYTNPALLHCSTAGVVRLRAPSGGHKCPCPFQNPTV